MRTQLVAIHHLRVGLHSELIAIALCKPVVFKYNLCIAVWQTINRNSLSPCITVYSACVPVIVEYNKLVKLNGWESVTRVWWRIDIVQ